MPTFASNRDRVTYLLAEYMIPLSFVGGAILIWLLAFTPEVPEIPESVLAGSLAAGLLAFPSFFLAKWVIGRFAGSNMMLIGVSMPGEEPIHQTWKVPPEVWSKVEVEGPRPMRDVDGVDAVVTSFEWIEDTETLRVRGCDRAEMDPAEAWADATRVEQYYSHYLETLRSYASLKTRVGEKVTETHDATIMEMLGAREQAELSPGVDVTDLIGEIEDDEPETLPDAPDPWEEYDRETADPEALDFSMGMGSGGVEEAAPDGGYKHE